MSVILKALRTQKETSPQGDPDSQLGQLVWGDRGDAHLIHPPTKKGLLVLLSVFLCMLVISLGLWLYKGSVFGDKKILAHSKVRATKAFSLSAPLVPGIPLGIIEKARTYFEEGRFDESLSLYKKAVRAKPENALLHNSLGLTYLKKEMYPESKVHFERAVKLDKGCAECVNNLGYLISVSGNPIEAEKYLRKAADLKRDYPDPYFNLGVLYEKSGDLANAANAYTEFLTRFPDKKAKLFRQVQSHLYVLKEP